MYEKLVNDGRWLWGQPAPSFFFQFWRGYIVERAADEETGHDRTGQTFCFVADNEIY